MAINFPNSPTNGQSFSSGGKTYVYNSTSGVWDRKTTAIATVTDVSELTDTTNVIPADISDLTDTGGVLGTGGATVYADMAALIAATGMSNGDLGLVSANNNVYIYNGSGWYKIATVQNDSPSAITGVNGTYSLETDGTPTVITAVSTDPEGFPLTWTYSTSGLGSIATVSQADNVFTITPSTTEADAGTFTLTLNATDGVNGAVSANTNLILEFIVIVENSNYTALLATAVDTSVNNGIADSSTNNHTITVNGDAHAGSFSPYRHGGYSTYFPDSGWGPYTDNVIAPSSDFAFGTGAFTVSFWYKFEHSFSSEIFDTRQTSVDMNGFRIWIGPAGDAKVYYATSTVLTATTTAAVGVWGHICVTRDGSGNLKIFLNGTQAASITDNNNYTAQGLNIGNSNGGTNDFRGWMKDIHVVKGYSYEPDTASIYSPAQVDVGTVFLGCTTASMRDVSTAARTISSSTGFTYTTEVPNNNIEYSAAVHGGSVYFDGTGDYLEVANSTDFDLGSTWTIKGWMYPDAVNVNTQYNLISNQGSLNRGFWIGLQYVSGWRLRVGIYNSSGGWAEVAGTGGTITADAWNYIEVNYASGTLTIKVNGIQDTSGSVHQTGATTQSLIVGSARDASDAIGTPFKGYFSDLQIVNGSTAPESSVPSTLMSTDTNSKLHIKGTDASIIDKSQASNLTLVGNTTGSTTQVKFADTKSMYFDGSGDSVFVPYENIPSFGIIEFTIEGWIYMNNLTGNQLIVDKWVSGNSQGFQFYYRSTGTSLTFYTGNTIVVQDPSGSTISAQTWHHVAVTRDSGANVRLYVDGLKKAQSFSAVSLDNTLPLRLGASATSTNYFNGYMQDVKLSNKALYTADDESSNIPSEPLKG